MKCLKCEKRDIEKKKWVETSDYLVFLIYYTLLFMSIGGMIGFAFGYSLCLDTIIKFMP